MSLSNLIGKTFVVVPAFSTYDYFNSLSDFPTTPAGKLTDKGNSKVVGVKASYHVTENTLMLQVENEVNPVWIQFNPDNIKFEDGTIVSQDDIDSEAGSLVSKLTDALPDPIKNFFAGLSNAAKTGVGLAFGLLVLFVFYKIYKSFKK